MNTIATVVIFTAHFLDNRLRCLRSYTKLEGTTIITLTFNEWHHPILVHFANIKNILC